jgi:Fe-S-cluster-containing dehydrogenase component/CRP-like cAMP-binding protein
MMGSLTVQRPERWDNPFSRDMSEAAVDRILGLDLFRDMDPSRFPSSVSLRDIVRNDTRIQKYYDGDIVVRAGDYGNSAFLIISGGVRVVLPPGLPERLLGRREARKKGLLEALGQLWTNPRLPEVRDPSRYDRSRGTGARHLGKDETHIFLQDVPAVLDEHGTVQLGPGEMFGEIAALGRTPRTATIFAEGDAELLEIRWQGIRDMRRRVDDFRRYVDQLYRDRSLKAHLQETPMFRHLGDDVIDKIAQETLFETYGDFDWHASYKKLVEGSASERLAHEPIIAHEGDYPDGLLMVRAGFARVSQKVNHGHRTVRYIGRGDHFGFEEIAHNLRSQDGVCLRHTLRAIGYTDILRVPTSIIEEHVLPTIPPQALPPLIEGFRAPTLAALAEGAAEEIDPGMLEFLVENRYINGTATMLIDLDRCVRCDECMKACAKAHNNNPVFNRHGRRYGSYMVANACMHCTDPVCMIGCPTGAIHRSSPGGQVVINDDTCIGCAICANSCPYDNIRMVEIRDRHGNMIRDHSTSATILKATKCDLCADQWGGPACQRACPHDALWRADMRDLPSLANWANR